MMDKKSNEGLHCVYCGSSKLVSFDPPVCDECVKLNKTASDKDTLASIEQDDSIWDRL